MLSKFVCLAALWHWALVSNHMTYTQMARAQFSCECWQSNREQTPKQYASVSDHYGSSCHFFLKQNCLEGKTIQTSSRMARWLERRGQVELLCVTLMPKHITNYYKSLPHSRGNILQYTPKYRFEIYRKHGWRAREHCLLPSMLTIILSINTNSVHCL